MTYNLVNSKGIRFLYGYRMSGQARSQDADARTHNDIKKLRNIITKVLGRDWGNQPADAKLLFGGELFLPCLTKEETGNALMSMPNGAELGQQIQDTSTFWQDTVIITATTEELPSPKGEIFFEPGDGYKLVPL